MDSGESSETEEELPMYHFHSESDDTNGTEVNSSVELNAAETVAVRERHDLLYDKLEELEKSMRNLETHADAGFDSTDETNHSSIASIDSLVSSPASIEDTDAKSFVQQAREMRVKDPTVHRTAPFQLLFPQLAGRFFGHETLDVEKFVSHKLPSRLFIALKNSSRLREILRGMDSEVLQTKVNTTADLCSFFFYVMSVHPDYYAVDGCLTYLCLHLDYRPTSTDIFTVLLNWGVEERELFEGAPEGYVGAPKSVAESIPMTEVEIKDHNFHAVLQYLKTVLLTNSHHLSNYHCLLVPLLRLILDARIYRSRIKTKIWNVIDVLMKQEGLSAQELHLKDLSLENQTILCRKVLNMYPIATTLAYATLQQFLQQEEIIYCESIDLNAVFDMLVQKKDCIKDVKLCEVSYLLRLIDFLIYRKLHACEDVHTTQESIQKGLDLLNEWSVHIQRDDRSYDPILLKEQIAQISYCLKMKQLPPFRSQCDTPER